MNNANKNKPKQSQFKPNFGRDLAKMGHRELIRKFKKIY